MVTSRAVTLSAISSNLNMSRHTNTFVIRSVNPKGVLITVNASLSISTFKASSNSARVAKLSSLIQEKSIIANTGSFFKSSVQSGVTFEALVGSITPGTEFDSRITVLALEGSVVDILGLILTTTFSVISWNSHCSIDDSTGSTVS